MDYCGFVLILIGFSLAAQAQPGDEAKRNQDRLQGTWKLVHSEVQGKGYKVTNDIRVTFEKDIMISLAAGQIVGKYSVKLDPTKTPKEIDFVTLENQLAPESKGTKSCCIYELGIDCLKVRSPTSGFPAVRPKEFATKEGSSGNLQQDIAQGGSLETYERVKP